jgi:protein SCO1/2
VDGPTPGVQRLLWTVLFLVIAGVVVAALRSESRRGVAPLPVYGVVPEFTLTERSGRSVSAADLRGAIWVANFVFTACPGMCPGLSARMASLQQRLQPEGQGGGPEVRLVSFSVDPEHDTPRVLRDYADRFRADPERWLFLTGARDTMYPLVRDGFRLSVAELPADARAGAPEPITHSDRFVLVDPALQIRGYYHGTDTESVGILLGDIERLRRE